MKHRERYSYVSIIDINLSLKYDYLSENIKHNTPTYNISNNVILIANLIMQILSY